jgi:hypothetical protein
MSNMQRRKGAVDMDEIWKPCPMYEDRYEVSNLGRIRAATWARIGGSKPGRILYEAKDDRGYSQVYLYRNYRQHTVKVHRLVAVAFLGERLDGMTVNHIDGNKQNNSVSNLEYVSNLENCRHEYRSGRRAHVEINGERLSINEAVEKYAVEGVGYHRVRARISRHGWDLMTALTTPVMSRGRPSNKEREALHGKR